jgi:hypothetical protein
MVPQPMTPICMPTFGTLSVRDIEDLGRTRA